MFGKKKRSPEQAEYEAYSADEGYQPLFTDAEEPEDYSAADSGAWSDAPEYEGYDGQGEYEEYEEYDENGGYDENGDGQESTWAADDYDDEYDGEP